MVNLTSYTYERIFLYAISPHDGVQEYTRRANNRHLKDQVPNQMETFTERENDVTPRSVKVTTQAHRFSLY